MTVGTWASHDVCGGEGKDRMAEIGQQSREDKTTVTTRRRSEVMRATTNSRSRNENLSIERTTEGSQGGREEVKAGDLKNPSPYFQRKV